MGSFTSELGDILKSYIFPILSIVGLGLITYFVYVPYVSQIPVMVNEQKRLDENIQTLDENIIKLEAFNELPLDAMTSTLDELIPTEARVAELVNTLTDLASQSGIVLTIPDEQENASDEEDNDEGIVEDISAGESDSGTQYQIKRIPVTLSFSGTRVQVEQYLRLIREEPRVLSVEMASVRISGTLWEVELEVDGFRGEILTTSTSNTSRIEAQSESVLTPVHPIDVELNEMDFNQVTSSF